MCIISTQNKRKSKQGAMNIPSEENTSAATGILACRNLKVVHYFVC